MTEAKEAFLTRELVRAREAHWQSLWAREQCFRTDDDSDREKFYVLAQFPYPSGSGLHMGHVAIYTYADVIARFKLHQGYEVLHPMGWDAFGLPTENHAIAVGIHPSIITQRNCDNFRRQLKALGLSYDWSREINTSDPAYYRWTQWIWKRLYEAGLTYKTKTSVNWCPALKIVLANEEIIDGKSERGGHPVVKRWVDQWMFKITAYAEKLLDGLVDLDWPEGSKKTQQDWIGRSEGALVNFSLEKHPECIEVYTTRPDTLFGATYMVLAPEHPLVEKITTPGQRESVASYQKQAAAKSDFDRAELVTEKTGVFTGANVVNPVNGKSLPVWIADYVLYGYGTGAIMAVPAHDKRDFEFAKTFDLPSVQVLLAPGRETEAELGEALTGDGTLIHSAHADLNLNGLDKKQAIAKTIAWLETKKLGRGTVQYKLRDWIFARQRYWGEPFPILYRDMDGAAESVPDDQLPVRLPEVESYQPTDTGKSPLANIHDWVAAKTAAGEAAHRETDTMPQWAGSCWYYLRFMDPHNRESFASMARQKRWGQVDVYVGGTEHLNLHDLYSRFWHRALYDLGLVAEKEPFQKLLHQGMVLGPDGSKMSKSAGNIVNPDEILEVYGADVLRLNLCFMGPVEANKPWNDTGLEAMRRYISRTTRLFEEHVDHPSKEDGREVLIALNKTVQTVTQDMERYRFNTAIAHLMELLNVLQKQSAISRETLNAYLLMLSPFAPHFCEAMWQRLNPAAGVSMCRAAYPVHDEALCQDDEVEIVVQLNGKIKLRRNIPAGLDADAQSARVLKWPEVEQWLEGKTPRKVIAVPGRLVNIIV